MKKGVVTLPSVVSVQSIYLFLTLFSLCYYAASQELVRSPHFNGPLYEADDDTSDSESESESEENFRIIPVDGSSGQSRYGLAEDIAEAASDIQEAMKDLQQSSIWPESSNRENRNDNDGEYRPMAHSEYMTGNDGDHYAGSGSHLHGSRYPVNGSYYRAYRPLKRSYGDKEHLNGTYTPNTTYDNVTGSDQDTSGSAAQEETSENDAHEPEGSEKSEGIDHEPGNIPFEWRVQLIHRNMGDSWKNRADRADGESSGNNDRWYDRFTDHMGHGHMRERYTKKKVDILIEEWWNKEKWNRKYWDDHADEDEEDRRHRSNHYHDSDSHKHYNKGRGGKARRYHGHGSQGRRKGGYSHHKPRYTASGTTHEDVLPSYQVLQNTTNGTGIHNVQRQGYGTVSARYYGDPGDVLRQRPKLRTRPMKTWNAYQPKMEASSFSRPSQDGRPACARPQADFCEIDNAYPNDVIRRLIAANESAWRSLSASAQARWKPFVFRPNKEVNSQSQPSSSHSCYGDVREVRPLWAPNYNGRWKIIVNTGKYIQTFMMDKCSKRTWMCATSQDYTCKQKKGILPLVALDLTNSPHELHTDWFVLPSTCVCKPTTY